MAGAALSYPGGAVMSGHTVYAGFTTADLATLTPSRLESVCRLLPARTAEQLRQAWRDALEYEASQQLQPASIIPTYAPSGTCLEHVGLHRYDPATCADWVEGWPRPEQTAEQGQPSCSHRCSQGRNCGGCGCPGCGYGPAQHRGHHAAIAQFWAGDF